MLVFERIFLDDAVDDIVAVAKENDIIPISEQTEKLFYGVEEKKEILDQIIAGHLKNWSISRISRVSLAVLRLAVYEMKYSDDISDEIAISEAVKITQTFSVKEDVTFVNGVLASVSREK